MPAYLKSSKSVHKHANLYREGTNKETFVNFSGKPTHVSLLINRLSDKEKRGLKMKNFSIKDFRFATSPDLSLYNLSKLGFEQHFNFVFSEEDLEEMLNTPKVIVTDNYFKATDIQENEYFIHRLYMIAPNLKDKELPLIYRLSIQTCPAKHTYSVSMQAVVGGCRDGAVNLIRVDSPHEIIGQMEDDYIDKPHIHIAESNTPNRRFEHLPKYFEEAENVKTLQDAVQLLMDKSGIGYYSMGSSEMKVVRLAEIFAKDKAHKIAEPVNAEILLAELSKVKPDNLELREFIRNKREVTIGDLDLI